MNFSRQTKLDAATLDKSFCTTLPDPKNEMIVFDYFILTEGKHDDSTVVGKKGKMTLLVKVETIF